MATSKIATGVLAPVKSKCAEVVGEFDAITHVWGGGSNPDHITKRCIDFMIPTLADGQAVAGYVWESRRRLGVRLIIWNRHIIRVYDKPGIPAGTWARYTGDSPHTDHPHVEFDSSAYTAPAQSASLFGAGAVTAMPARIKIGSRLYDDIRTVAAKWVNREIIKFQNGKPTQVTREVFYVQSWLKKVAMYTGALSGHWDQPTQRAFDRYRTERMDLEGSDAEGTVGVTSLSHLRSAAKSKKKVA